VEQTIAAVGACKDEKDMGKYELFLKNCRKKQWKTISNFFIVKGFKLSQLRKLKLDHG